MEGYSSNKTFSDRSEIPLTKLLEIVDSCKALGVKAIEITGGGEPTFHPNFVRLCHAIQYAGIQYGVVTNGASLTDEKLEALHHATWVRFSIDAGTPGTYANTRRSKSNVFYRVHENIRRLVGGRIGPNPLVGVGFVVSKENYPEILLAAMQAQESGADNIRISAVFQPQGAAYFDGIRKPATDLCRTARELRTPEFEVFDLFSDRVDDLTQGAPDYSDCYFSQLCTYVGADLNVYRCCVTAYNPQGLLGSLQDQTLEQLWTAPSNLRNLKDFDARSCTHCMFNAKNRTIAYLINRYPEHVNFL